MCETARKRRSRGALEEAAVAEDHRMDRTAGSVEDNSKVEEVDRRSTGRGARSTTRSPTTPTQPSDGIGHSCWRSWRSPQRQRRQRQGQRQRQQRGRQRQRLVPPFFVPGLLYILTPPAVPPRSLGQVQRRVVIYGAPARRSVPRVLSPAPLTAHPRSMETLKASIQYPCGGRSGQRSVGLDEEESAWEWEH